MNTNETSANPSCFLTTATVDVMGMPEDCEPLTLARFLRDEKMVTDNERAAVDLYYKVAPKVVVASNDEEWMLFWKNHLREITALARAGEYELAKDMYTVATAKLVDAKSTNYADKETVDDVFDFGMDKLFGGDFTKGMLPYPVRFGLLKMGMKTWASIENLRIRAQKRKVAHILKL